MALTCQHGVAAGAWCRYCGVAVDSDLVRALAFVPAPAAPVRALGSVPPVPTRDPDIELFEENVPVMAGECGNCHRPVLVSAAGWTRCNCGSDTTVIR
jgi:hypothetical protein